MGWSANVITTVPKDEPIDERLLSDIPIDTVIQRVMWEDRVDTIKRFLGYQRTHITDKPSNCCESVEPQHVEHKSLLRSSITLVKDWGTGLLQLPDSRSGWIRPAICSAMQMINRHPVDLIYSTSPYASAHLISLKIKRQTNLPWVADFRDPWCGNPYTKKPFMLHRYIEARMERSVLESADRIVVNTPAALEKLINRYPGLQHKCMTILNGFDADIIDRITPIRTASSDTFSLVHCGQFYGPRTPLFLFKAIKSLIQSKPQLARRFKLTLVGSASYDGKHLKTIAKELGVESVVHIVGEKSHWESLGYMAGGDGLALIGSTGTDANLQIPNKLFEYLAMKKTVLAVFPDSHPAVEILRQAKVPFESCQLDDVQSIATALENMIKTSCEHRVGDSRSAVDQYDRKHRATELVDLFNQLAGEDKSPGGRILNHASANVIKKKLAIHQMPQPDESPVAATTHVGES